ncbi:hypothetical protein ACWEPB_04325 [Kitasatospora cineracea]
METENSITGGSFAAGVLQVGSLSLDKPSVRPSGLPPRGLFVNRAPLLADLVTELATGEGPLLVSALAGLGGIGKTALAVEAAHRARTSPSPPPPPSPTSPNARPYASCAPSPAPTWSTPTTAATACTTWSSCTPPNSRWTAPKKP